MTTSKPQPKPLRAWAMRFRSRDGGWFHDAYLRVGSIEFHLDGQPGTRDPSVNAWRYSIRFSRNGRIAIDW